MLSKKILNEIKTLTLWLMLFLAVELGAADVWLSARVCRPGGSTAQELPHVSGLPQGIRVEYFTPEVALFQAVAHHETQLHCVCVQEKCRLKNRAEKWWDGSQPGNVLGARSTFLTEILEAPPANCDLFFFLTQPFVDLMYRKTCSQGSRDPHSENRIVRWRGKVT